MVGGGAVMVAFIIAVLQGSLRISLLMALSIIMVVLQVTLQERLSSHRKKNASEPFVLCAYFNWPRSWWAVVAVDIAVCLQAVW